MNTYTFLALVALIAAVGAPTQAQENRGASSQRRNSVRLRSIESVLQSMTRASGVTVVAESSFSGLEAGVPRETATAQNLESLLDDLVKTLPAGTVWKKAMLPASTRFYKGDDVADFLAVQARMLGRTPPPEAGMVEILGQKLTPEKAAPVVSTLGLKPVYVLINVNARQLGRDPLAGANGQSDFSGILNNFASMDPTARMKLMQQFGQMMQNLTPEQRRQMLGGGGDIRLGIPPKP